ncbi:MAG: cytochrome c oxidase accessory protein CcoG [Candidatus Sedimenticola endophacoides]|uniref:Cytochrome c oxidase accessory protein CcoG n=1 Tax=Candidatus Sedimenticola endophacoides TaxID=2548426 RepID=A0A657PXU2_9GAMM|nr:MAG: cytochrome c oxidase accessory protein CcoG [Candidatus Sedimenticola endophacoides]OQX35145.1 MAG: cytochrome c oxidase accessory protein CcoG [Candidatus Sedimenticola endophacoides]OQX40646.1 MAG: cytochrome c oxidase accessory protein CcoG [Candidatus Sedimenticola endophacoides]OQX44894.1 MAG: cytochrome c oxidase accessory protein CcoG [Candidatus Sedimenticola endophacoides]OQX48986.1 MAG: cytochrome c oxidase accessory protein CcoG [Candidatus Sedimenticola endophacoides]
MNREQAAEAAIEDLYAEAGHYHVNTGEETIHAKRVSGKWRTFKWWTSAVWIVFLIGPYLRWGDRQAVLFDIPNRQFHIFGVTVLPQDFWMLSLVLLFFAILLAVVTTLVGRVWCGFFCFQTVWTDLFTWIEERLEGSPQKRVKLDQAPWGATKIRIKVTKHLLWLLVGLLTGISFVAWFVDAFELWGRVLSLEVSGVALITIALFTVGTYGLAGFLREQVCFWLCPYARIQGVMVDETTALPTYDFYRGEPRGRAKKGKSQEELGLGDCVDCNQCVAVCPTGVDIRHGQQEGCITCALCIDACDTVMIKLDRPTGLIRYESLLQLEGKEDRPMLKRPRVWVYSAILAAAIAGIAYGLSTLDAVGLKVLHERQPLYVLQSDGSVSNKYTLKVLNKMTEELAVRVSASGPPGLVLVGAEEPVMAAAGKVTPRTVFVRVPRENLTAESVPISFRIETEGGSGQRYSSERKSFFAGPKR